MDIHRSSIKDFIMPKLKSVYIIDYYEGIQSVLTGRDDFNFKDFFANPRIRTQNEIIWSTETFSKNPILLSSLSGYEKEKYSYILNQAIHSVERLIEVLNEEEGGKPLSELLKKSIPYIDEKSVYCGDDNVVIVNWGLIPRTQTPINYQIYRSGEFIGNWDKRFITPPLLKTEIKKEEKLVKVLANDTKTSKENDKEHKNIIIEDAPTLNVSDNVLNNKDITIDLEDIQEVVKITPSQKDGIKKSEQRDTDFPTLDICKKETMHKIKENNYSWKTFIRNFLQGLKFLFKKLFWIIVLILLFIFMMYLLKDCQGPVHKINPYYNPLPDKSIVLPIDTAHIGVSSDGFKIATDRLNILIDQYDDNTIKEWAEAFKKIYDSEQYEIVYYNKELDLLQIRVPDNERERIKQNLPNEIPQFNFEVFEENIQECDVLITDPMISDPEKSWYLNPIGANGAWDITLGDNDVTIAVVDNGFDLSHPEFLGKVYNAYNVLMQNDYVRPIFTINGIDAHGTHVAATAAGNYNNGTGLLGIAPNCKLMLIQVGNDNAFGGISTVAVREGIMYAINNGADVINVSLGMNIPDFIKYMSEGQQLNFITSSHRAEELIWNKVYSFAKKRNCTIVFAAGNENVIAGIDPKKRSKNIIKVSAIDKEIEKADFSNYGVYPNLNREYATLSAPGVSIYSAAPLGQYMTMDGTSMAAPIVSGAVALLKSLDKSLTTDEIISLLKKTGEDVGNNIGPMINICNALKYLKGDTTINNKCDDIKKEIERLRAKIDSLSRICPNAAEPADTLKYNDAVRDKNGLDGDWKSSTQLVSTSDKTPLELYMSFRKQKGTLTIINKGIRYTAELKVDIKDGKINIIQMGPAKNGENSFIPYVYECRADNKGNLLCVATSTETKVVFNLIRI